jgi:hypothetical protein
MFGIFGQEKRPPLTEYCVTLSAPANLLKSANAMCIGDSSGIDKRAIVLALVIMAAAGDFVGGLRWDRAVMWKGSRHYLRNTNLDVIAAEAIVWMHFLMRQFWEKNVEKEYQSFMQTGRIESQWLLIGEQVFPTAHEIALSMIQGQTGFDFNKTGSERRKRYEEALKDGEELSLIFASVVLHSVGRKSLAEPMKNLGPVPLVAEWGPLSLKTMTFFSTMPSAFYETFKNFLKVLDEQEFEDLYRSRP